MVGTPPRLDAADLDLLRERGLTSDDIFRQWRRIRVPPPPVRLVRPCRVGDGIVRLHASDIAQAADRGHATTRDGRVTIFVPASGAATRMFRDLLAALAASTRPSELPTARALFDHLDEFPFAGELRRLTGLAGPPRTEEEERHLLSTLLGDMRMATLPKALVPFHPGAPVRTAFEAQILEGVRYNRDRHGVCRLHFTIPAGSQADFDALLAEVHSRLTATHPGTRLSVTFSTQRPSTDTVALTDAGAFFRNTDHTLLLRPGGHGALLGNLQDLGGDIVVIKNIDNVLPDEAGADVVHWKRVLVGYFSGVQAALFDHLRHLHEAGAPDATTEQAMSFAAGCFGWQLPADLPPTERRAWAIEALDRPLRICGVVRNEGEPGGAPFWVQDTTGRVSAQIVEPSQVDMGDPTTAGLVSAATHFNPVDLVCGLRSWRGDAFPLAPYVDEDTAFVTRKSSDGRALLALERPGLWNGAMAGWNSVYVEVPASTFAPVKTVFDLLRPGHQGRASSRAIGGRPSSANE